MSANDKADAAWNDYVFDNQETEIEKLQERIKQLEDRIHRASMAFFRDGSDGHVASQMLQILEEERRKQ